MKKALAACSITTVLLFTSYFAIAQTESVATETTEMTKEVPTDAIQTASTSVVTQTEHISTNTQIPKSVDNSPAVKPQATTYDKSVKPMPRDTHNLNRTQNTLATKDTKRGFRQPVNNRQARYYIGRCSSAAEFCTSMRTHNPVETLKTIAGILPEMNNKNYQVTISITPMPEKKPLARSIDK